MTSAAAAVAQTVPAGLDWQLALIPLITGVIGYATNWVAIRLLFNPVDFVGFRLPGLKRIAPSLPRKIQQIPGVLEGHVGWQGIIPSRSARMGSLAAEKGISNIATEREFYQEFDPDKIAEHVLTNSRQEIRALTEEILETEHPQLWSDTPRPVRELVHARVQSRLPEVVDTITAQIGDNIDELLDLTVMIRDHLARNPELLNRLFTEAGERELKFIINSGFFVGTFLGMFSIPLFLYIDQWWVLPVCGVAVGYLTNWIALKIIFQPTEPRQLGSFRLQGLFIKRQDEVAEAYASVVADDIITVSNISESLLSGPQSDRTRKMITDAIRPEIDRAMGLAAPTIRVATGTDQYERVREAFATESVDRTFAPLRDPAFNRERSEAIRSLIRDRMRTLEPDEFAGLLRPAFEEDEWMLILMGAVLGFVAGWLQLLVVTAV